MKPSHASVVLLSWLCLFVVSSVSAGLSVNGYRNVIIPDIDNDPLRIGIELRRQASDLGFTVYLTPDAVPESEWLKTCGAVWGWRAWQYSGNIQLRLYDFSTGSVVAEGLGKAVNWVGTQKAVKVGVRHLWESIGYRGFSEATHRQNVQGLFPERPRVDISEADLKAKTSLSRIEGIWTDPENRYRIGIVEAQDSEDYRYIGFVLGTTHPGWSNGEIKLEINPTASSAVFVGNYYRSDKKREGTTFLLERDVTLTFELSNPQGGKSEFLLVRSWPQAADIASGGGEEAETTAGSGTGFFVSIKGLVATNWHVVEGAESIDVFPMSAAAPYRASVAIKDATNDLAVLRLENYIPPPDGCLDLPYILSSAADVKLGQKIMTLGYPLGDLLGSHPKYTEGVISSRSGIQDDPRALQITAEIQPGSSGSPLIDSEGRVLGVVVASINARFLYKLTEALPQNINFAVKSDYLLNLLSMLPEEIEKGRGAKASPDEISLCIVAIRTSIGHR